MPGLVPEAVKERIQHEVPVVPGDLPAVGPRGRDRECLPMRAHRSLAAAGCPRREQDVADVVRRDGRGALGGEHGGRGSRPALELGPAEHFLTGPSIRADLLGGSRSRLRWHRRVLNGNDHDQPQPTELARLRLVGGSQRGEAVCAEERPGHEQRACAAPADDIQRFGSGEPGVDRHQRGASSLRAERCDDPVVRVRRPDRDPVAGLNTRRRRARPRYRCACPCSCR